jgi:transposase
MSKSQLAYLGIDISKQTFDVYLIMGEQHTHAVFANKPGGFVKLQNWLNNRGVDLLHACMEATGVYGQALTDFLHGAGVKVSVVNPFAIKSFGQSRLRRNKTDKLDAKLIAEYCKTLAPPAWQPWPQHYRTLQALVRRRETLKNLLLKERNRLSETKYPPIVQQDIQEHIMEIQHRIQFLQKTISHHIHQHPDLHKGFKLLCTIKGIGIITAAYLLAEIGPIHYFKNARQLAAYAGLTPRHNFSGTSVRGKTPLSKRGNAALRNCLFMPAMVAKRYNPIIQAFSQRLATNGKTPMEIIGAAMRKLLHIVFGVLKSGKPFDPNFQPVCP